MSDFDPNCPVCGGQGWWWDHSGIERCDYCFSAGDLRDAFPERHVAQWCEEQNRSEHGTKISKWVKNGRIHAISHAVLDTAEGVELYTAMGRYMVAATEPF